MTLTNIRDGIATNLSTITGLRAFAEMPDNPAPPTAIVSVGTIDYNTAFQNGLTTYNFVVSVLVAKAAERYAQRALNDYADASGAKSIKAAIESDRTLGGYANDVRVIGLTNIGSLQLNEATYLVAEFSVTAYAN